MKKGFTLIELLAVIVILAIIALIATPLIMNVIDEAKRGSFENSAYGIVKAAEIAYATDILSGNDNEIIITYNNGEETIEKGREVQHKGDKPKNGKIKINKNGEIAIVLHNGSHCAIKPYHLSKITVEKMDKKDCEFEKIIDDSGANAPILVSGMIPIKWDSNNNEISTTETDYDWYNYEQKRWANAKSKDGSYWVWIPRYAYKIESGYHSSTTGTIDVKFLKGTGNETLDGTPIEISGYEAGVKDTSMYYFVHPTFQNDINEYGFWVAKFEPTAAEGLSSDITDGSCNSADNVTTKTVKIVPNVTSWRCINIKNAYTVSLNMRNKTDVYGWKSEEVDTHMMTNHEWGAIAYLSKSQYGAPGEVWNNAYNEYKTGCSGNNVNSSNLSTCIEYNTENGVKASTTHNIYGVYDMSGGTWERVMGNYNNLEGSSGFTADEVRQIDSKYITRYETPSNEMLNGIGMDYDARVYGDGVYETSNGANRYKGNDEWEGIPNGSWYGEYSYLPYLSYPWLNRGGDWYNGSSVGVFSFDNGNGNADVYYSFRPVLAPMK